ncbi:MAG: ABC transporter ATP-binding protein [Candidatus Methanoperedens sp.]
MFDLQTSKQPSEDAIIVQNVSKHFRIPHERKTKLFEHIADTIKGNSSTYEEFWALKDVSFRVKKGETLAIIGENGSGKSTLLKVIAGVLISDLGSVNVKGRIAPFLELGVGFQPELTAEDNVRLYGAVMGMGKKEMEDKFEEIFDFAELSKFRNMKLKNFSSGMYARLAFATAMATDPEVLLIDEVLSVGDEAFQKKCMEKFNEFKRDGKTIVLVSHSLDLITKICKESVLLINGKLISKGTTEKVIDDYRRFVQEKKEKELLGDKDKIQSGDNKIHEMEIKEVKLFDMNRKETYSFNCGDELIIKVKYKLHKKVIDPLFQIQIFRDDGVMIHGMNTGREEIKSGEIDKDGEFEYLIKSLPLLEGTYFANIGLVSSWGGPHYDYHLNRHKFVVRSKKSDGAGIISMDHKWKLET